MSTIERLNAALEGNYVVEGVLGVGGMATVYAAQDIRHGRTVAVKVLSPELAALVGAERFLAEIRTTANLQHPHILPLYDSGGTEDLLFYVMPFIEHGTTLRDLLKKESQLPLEDTLSIIKAVASALDFAHEHGIIHRDIKPANILLQAGQPLVADFGISVAVAEAGVARLTQTGMSIGTPAYMAPEQILGEHEPDRRSDLFALATMTYEMLVGELPHAAPSGQGILLRILTQKPTSPTVRRPGIPLHVSEAILKGLETLPADRFKTVLEFVRALENPSFRRPQSTEVPATTRRSLLDHAAWATVAAAAAVTVLTLIFSADSGDELELLRFDISPTPALSFGEFFADPYPAVSPDGSAIALVANSSTAPNQLWVRALGEESPRPLERAINAQFPFWSPDGQHVAYYSGGRLMRIPVGGGPPVVLAQTSSNGGSWSTKGLILYATAQGFRSVPQSGGPSTSVTNISEEDGILFQRFPFFLPDGERYLYAQVGETPELSGVFLGSLDSTPARRLIAEAGNAIGAEPGLLVFVRAGSLMAQAFDLDSGELSGEAQEIVPGADIIQGTIRYAPFSVGGGTLAYRIRARPVTQVQLVDREGQVISDLGRRGFHINPTLSPDGSRMVVSQQDVNSPASNLWEIDIDRNVSRRMTTSSGLDSHPVWSPDGRRLIFASTRSGQFEIYERDFAAGKDTLIYGVAEYRSVPHSWGPDNTIIFTVEDGGGPEGDIWLLPLDDGEPRPIKATGTDESQGTLSPDGSLMAFSSDESGRWEVYVQRLEDGSVEIVSRNGGTNPNWRRDGRELYYFEIDPRTQSSQAATGDIMAVAISPQGRPSAATRLFQARLPVFAQYELRMFSASSDGQRFTLSSVVSETQLPLRVVRGWHHLLPD